MSGPARRWGRLRHFRAQTVLAAVALAVAVSLPVVLLSVGGGVSAHELHLLENTGFQVSVSAPGFHGILGAHALAARLSADPRIGAASPVLSLPIEMFRPGGGALPLLAEGVVPAAFGATLPPEEAGLFPHPIPLGDPTDLLHFANGSYAGPASEDLLLSSPIADAYDLSVGASVDLAATTNRSSAVPFTVTGVFGVPPTLLGPTGAFAAILPLSDLQLIGNLARTPNGSVVDAADTVEVALAGSAATDPAAVNAVAAEIQGEYPYYGVTTQDQTVAQAEHAAAILTGFYLALSSVGLAVGLLFVGLVLVRRVETMRPSIAIRRAIGVPARELAGEFALQALALTGAGVVGGLLLGAATIAALNAWGSAAVRSATGFTVYDPLTLGSVFGAVLGLGVAASLVATRSALRLSVPEALR